MSGKRGKNDAADAAAICEAVTRPNMRFVPVSQATRESPLTSCMPKGMVAVPGPKWLLASSQPCNEGGGGNKNCQPQAM